VRRIEVSVRSYFLDPVRVITKGSVVWGEWDSVAARGMWWRAYYGWWGGGWVGVYLLCYGVVHV